MTTRIVEQMGLTTLNYCHNFNHLQRAVDGAREAIQSPRGREGDVLLRQSKTSGVRQRSSMVEAVILTQCDGFRGVGGVGHELGMLGLAIFATRENGLYVGYRKNYCAHLHFMGSAYSVG